MNQIKPAMTYSRAGRTTIGPGCLSAVFGMGTGVSTRAWSPAVRVRASLSWSERDARVYGGDVVMRGGVSCVLPTPMLRWPRPVSHQLSGGRGGAAKRSAVSTGRLSVSPRLYVRPIDPVVSREPSSYEPRPDLGGSFTLICLQRLSVTHVATRRCR